MIHVKRDRQPPDIAPYTKKTSRITVKNKTICVTPYEAERQEAIDYYANEENFCHGEKKTKEKVPDIFKFYKKTEIREALDKIFLGKCAYCETRLTRSCYDIEHHRPKKTIVTADGKKIEPGYYWLGGDWDNLLLACQFCNRLGRHRGDDGAEESVGKGSHFPLTDESLRTTHHDDDLGQEAPARLLLEPCLDKDVESHFAYHEKGAIFSSARDELADMRATTSIRVYALEKGEITLARQKAITDLLEVISDIREFAERCHELNFQGAEQAKIDRTLGKFRKKLQRLVAMFDADQTYLGCKRFILRQIIEAGRLDDLQLMGCDPGRLYSLAALP